MRNNVKLDEFQSSEILFRVLGRVVPDNPKECSVVETSGINRSVTQDRISDDRNIKPHTVMGISNIFAWNLPGKYYVIAHKHI